MNDKKQITITICLSILILIGVFGVVNSIDIEMPNPTPTPVVTTTSAKACSHPTHIAVEKPMCNICGKSVTHTFGVVNHVVITNTKEHEDVKYCLICSYKNSEKKSCTYGTPTYTIASNGQHNKKEVCTVCNGNFLALEACTYINNVCNKCGAKKEVTVCTHPNVQTGCGTYATCGKQGLIFDYCPDCLAEFNHYVQPPTEEHIFNFGVCQVCGASDPNYSNPGSQYQYCNGCFELLSNCTCCNHTNLQTSVGQQPTCVSPGELFDYCSDCGYETEHWIVPATGEHSFNFGSCEVCGASDPNYSNPGGQYEYCNDCGELLSECTCCSHDNQSGCVASVDPTCTESGTTAGSYCTDCGETLEEPKTIPANGHSYIDGYCKDCDATDPDYDWGSGDDEEQGCSHANASEGHCPDCGMHWTEGDCIHGVQEGDCDICN